MQGLFAIKATIMVDARYKSSATCYTLKQQSDGLIESSCWKGFSRLKQPSRTITAFVGDDRFFFCEFTGLKWTLTLTTQPFEKRIVSVGIYIFTCSHLCHISPLEQ